MERDKRFSALVSLCKEIVRNVPVKEKYVKKTVENFRELHTKYQKDSAGKHDIYDTVKVNMVLWATRAAASRHHFGYDEAREILAEFTDHPLDYICLDIHSENGGPYHLKSAG